MSISTSMLELAAIIGFPIIGFQLAVSLWLHGNLKSSIVKLWDQKRDVNHCDDIHAPLGNRVERLELEK